MLVFGGRSAEHDVSRVTAVAVARALDPDRYEVVPVAITQRRALAPRRRGPRADRSRPGGAARPPSRSTGSRARAARRRGRQSRWRRARRRRRVPAAPRSVRRGRHDPGAARAGRPAVRRLRGRRLRGRDGQGDDEAGVRGVRAAPGRATSCCATARTAPRSRDRVERELGLPCFVKPANMGSSVGVSKAHDRAELDAAIDEALEFDEWIIAEEAVDGPRDRGRGARRRAAGGVGAGRDRPGCRVLHVRGQVRGRRGRAARPGAARRGADRRGAARSRSRRSRRVAARRWPASTSSSRRTAAGSSSTR